MNKKKLLGIAILLFISIVLLVGCSQSKEEEIFKILESVVELEKGFEEQQEPLVQLEEEEKALYEEILNLGLKETEQINKLSDEAIALSEQRKELLNLERESIEKAEKEFTKIKEQIEQVEDEALKKLANDLYTIMNHRYESHSKLYEQYQLGIQYDQELYNMLKDESVSLEQLRDKVDEINSVYEEVYSLNETFNQLTQQYNEAKIEFYNKAELNYKLNE
ncbi:YkyA family protein [Pallidibacillus pasinlerensis]|uniref:PARP alpha-helical domain-containing protein n=1 Tax=Pallidibacillus pasinlerensis TaxID=2703818 RepID=A0ABX0A2N1_9BACI|nr:YkyA family protein [Pallidibacillus pasinlerensis]NCU17087.1 hypothetical protein [Pallidibacillus pasinlerensis]